MDIFTRKQAKIHKSYLILYNICTKNPYIRQEKYIKLYNFSDKLWKNERITAILEAIEGILEEIY
jgi:hypothetical protein